MRLTLSAVVALAVTLSATAENAAYVLAYPWEDAASVEIQTDAIFQDRGDSDGTAFETKINSYDSSLRWRADNTTTDTLMAAFQYNVLDIDTNDPLLPDDQLINTSTVISTGKIVDEHWKYGLQVGVGYAGDNQFGNGSATYGLGLLSAVNTVDDNTQLIYTISYDGNRNVWHDAPLPGFIYKKTVSDEFSYLIGVPVSGFTWTPDNHWTLSIHYKLLYNLDATLEYAIDENLSLFAQFLNSVQAYSISGDTSNRRVFFTQRRLEAGLNWTPTPGADLTLAVGQAFDQEFERGWDNWDTDSVREISDEGYLRAALNLNF
jgi:hypothetical protein